MLCLTRLVDEWIDVSLPDGRLVSIVVIETSKGKVRLGIIAPDDVAVDRREVRLTKEASCDS